MEKCTHCPKTPKNSYSHKKTMSHKFHTNGSCEICGHVSENLKDYKAHSLTHSSYGCLVCCRLFAFEKLLLKHLDSTSHK